MTGLIAFGPYWRYVMPLTLAGVDEAAVCVHRSSLGVWVALELSYPHVIWWSPAEARTAADALSEAAWRAVPWMRVVPSVPLQAQVAVVATGSGLVRLVLRQDRWAAGWPLTAAEARAIAGWLRNAAAEAEQVVPR